MVHEEIGRAPHKGLPSKNANLLKYNKVRKPARKCEGHSGMKSDGRENQLIICFSLKTSERVSPLFYFKADKSEILEQTVESTRFS